MPELSAVEIDHDHDLVLASALAAASTPGSALDVDVVITDFDGVHTDDSALVNEDGHESSGSAARTAWASSGCARPAYRS